MNGALPAGYQAPLFNDERATVERIEKFISKVYFTDCNLRSHLYGRTAPLSMKHAAFGTHFFPFSLATSRLHSHGEPVEVGFEFGPTWTTHWFQLDFSVPDEWTADTFVVRFDVECEALIWSVEGRPVLGLSPDFGRTDLRVPKTGNSQRLYVETSAGSRMGVGDGDCIRPAKLDKFFKIITAEVSEFFSLVEELLVDFEMLLEMAQFLPMNNHRRYQALYTANYMINCLVTSSFSETSQRECHAFAQKFFAEKNGSSQLTLYAIGNCHIDTAWLWRFDETKRKCARSWASTLHLMDENENMTFALSQAQQLVWLRDQYPTIYEELQDRSLDGKLVGVGGSWVEMDGNMPSGESMIRQLLYGQREFKETFRSYCDIFWLPDTFGYSAQLPQIMRHCGMKYFVTQKMSWSFVNKFPHHSFRWFGIDGTEVLAHFPPHHYVAQITVKECLESGSNFTDHGRSNIAMMLYGHGDGGGGPDEIMLKRAERLVDCDGVPRVLHSTPAEFFAELEKDKRNLCEWRGELYLELHNGTYTTQSHLKKLNRLMESILRDHEFVQAMKLMFLGRGRSLREEWQVVLLNQFHDILPGSCLKEVVTDAKCLYISLLKKLAVEKECGLKMLYDDDAPTKDSSSPRKWVLNSCGWSRIYFINNRFLDLPPFSILPLNELATSSIVFVKNDLIKKEKDVFILENRFLKATLNEAGQLKSVLVKSVNDSLAFKETISEGGLGNQFVIFDDVPLYWDAWDTMDYHLETRQEISKVESVELLLNSPEIAKVQFGLKISESSKITLTVCIRADQPFITFNCSVDWAESHKFLKVEFPVKIRSLNALYDIQYGHIERPTHRNTSWDSAKYEVCAHKWMALCEYNLGVALLNNCKYGHACDGNTMRLSLLRSSKMPDDTADIATHKFSYAYYPFMGSIHQPESLPELNVMRAAFEFNNQIRFIDGWCLNEPVSRVFDVTGDKGVMLETVKPCEDSSDTVTLRLYEYFGSHADVLLSWNHPRIVSIDESNGLEEVVENLPIHDKTDSNVEYVALSFRPFEIKTLLVHLLKMA
ncbi:hypothetical protein AB6A40_002489 [Gnathostoma spinigerum]|uniref:alpha-mannosidase n=1 Tax=Gnathostoma spinigerum TaxID=75299 RepID=A0ABD6EHI1_9BILA